MRLSKVAALALIQCDACDANSQPFRRRKPTSLSRHGKSDSDGRNDYDGRNFPSELSTEISN